MSKFSDRFRQLKEESGLTLKDLSVKLNITIPNLSYYMKGREPSYDILIKIADYFNVTTDWLIGKNDVRTSESLDLIEIIEKNTNNLFKDKLSESALENYLKIQEITTSILNDVYIFYCVARKSDDFLESIHHMLLNPFEIFARYINEFTKFIGTEDERLKITKDNIVKFLNNTELLSDSMSAMLIFPTIQYANFLSQVKGIPKSEYEAIHTIIDFVYDKFEQKYPNNKFYEIIEQLNKNIK